MDTTGKIYIEGGTAAAEYPTTSNAFQSSGPVIHNNGAPVYAVLTEVSVDGSKILYSTFLGSGDTTCSGGSVCIGVVGNSVANAIAVAPTGSVVIGGRTDASAFPVTAAVFPMCNCTGEFGFVASFTSSRALAWSTLIAGEATSLAIGSDGSVAILGVTGPGWPVPPSAFQPTFQPGPNPALSLTFFISKLNEAGTSLIATYFGNARFDTGSTLVLDSEGNIRVAVPVAPDFPVLPGNLVVGNNLVAERDPTLSHLNQSQLLLSDTVDRGFTLGSSGN